MSRPGSVKARAIPALANLRTKVRTDSFRGYRCAGVEMFIVEIIVQLIDVILSLVVAIVIAQVIASWLVAFGVVNTRNRAVYMIIDILDRATTPILRPIRRVIPAIGGLDLSPLIVLLLIDYVIRPIMRHYLLLDYQ